MLKKTILIDLDGVLNNYVGNFDPKFIPAPKSGVLDFLKNLSEKYDIKIFTTRDKSLVKSWINTNNMKELISGITNKKEVCWLYIDDRCLQFNGNYNDLLSEIENFKPWYK